jgi:hypothetical protein
LNTGFTIVGNPLNSTNNTLDGLFPAGGFGDTIYLYQGGTFVSSVNFGTWSPNLSMPPGVGAFYNANAGFTNTFVGEVLQGSLTNPIPAGFSLRASMVPQADTLGNLGFAGQFGDTVYYYRGGTYVSSINFGTWSPDEIVGVGEGFWVNSGGAQSWNRNFTVQ